MKTVHEEELIRSIRAWIRQHQQQMGFTTDEIADDTDLIATGVLDSLGFIELLVYLETVTGEKIDLDDLDPHEFTTVSGLCKSIIGRGQTRVQV